MDGPRVPGASGGASGALPDPPSQPGRLDRIVAAWIDRARADELPLPSSTEARRLVATLDASGDPAGDEVESVAADAARRLQAAGVGLPDLLALVGALEDAIDLETDHPPPALHVTLRRATRSAVLAHGEAEAAERAEHAELLHRSLRALGHEMKNVLSGGAAVTQALQATREQRRIDEMAEQLRGVFARLHALAEDVTSMALAQRRGPATGEQHVRLPALVDALVDDLRDMAARGRASLQVEDALPDVPVEAPLLGMALGQLVGDAVKYSDIHASQRWVKLRARCDENALSIFVEDNGVGLPDGVHERLFDPSFRPAENDSVRGSGVSLSLAREAVEQLGGRIRCEPREGGGRRFVVDLPLGPSSPRPA